MHMKAKIQLGPSLLMKAKIHLGLIVHMKAPARYNWAFSSSVCVKAEIQFGFVPPESTPVVAQSGQTLAHSGAAVARSQPGLPGWAIRGVLSGP